MRVVERLPISRCWVDHSLSDQLMAQPWQHNYIFIPFNSLLRQEMNKLLS